MMDNSNCNITPKELRNLDPKTVLLIDVRGDDAYQYGSMPGSINADRDAIIEGKYIPSKDKIIVCFCMWNVFSLEAARYLREQGYNAFSLEGGYGQWLKGKIELDEQNIERRIKIEDSIERKFKRELFTKFVQGICRYDMVQKGDKIAICISGGKDSMLMAKLFQKLKRHNKFSFDLEFLVMDPGYSSVNREIIESNAKMLGIPITVFETDIFEAVFHVEKSPCYLCARMRRGHLYEQAKKLGCNKIALGHHYDDVIETTLMSMLYGAEVRTMMPKLHSTNHPGMELIRPMYLIHEDDIKHWRDYNDLYFIQCACKFTESCTTCHTDGTTSSKRLEIKNLIKDLKSVNAQVENNIFKSMENVNLETVISYKAKGNKHHFLESY